MTHNINWYIRMPKFQTLLPSSFQLQLQPHIGVPPSYILFGGTVPPSYVYLAELFRQATFYLAELFRQATFYLAELFRQAMFYLAELFRQIALPYKIICVYLYEQTPTQYFHLNLMLKSRPIRPKSVRIATKLDKK